MSRTAFALTWGARQSFARPYPGSGEARPGTRFVRSEQAGGASTAGAEGELPRFRTTSHERCRLTQNFDAHPLTCERFTASTRPGRWDLAAQMRAPDQEYDCA